MVLGDACSSVSAISRGRLGWGCTVSDIVEAFAPYRSRPDRPWLGEVSPSELNDFRADLGSWYLKYLLKQRTDAGPAAWRGTATEAGFYALLSGSSEEEAVRITRESYENSVAEYTAKTEGVVHDDEDGERAALEPLISRAITAIKEESIPRPDTYQGRVELDLPGRDLKLIGYYDFGYATADAPYSLDLKTTNRMPSEEKAEHGIATAIYARARGEECAKLLYLPTGKTAKLNHRLITLVEREIDAYMRTATRTVRVMERLMRAAIAMSEYEAVEPIQALAELCEPDLLARGGGTYPIWKNDMIDLARSSASHWPQLRAPE
jgi:hypothetical protein